MLNVVQISRSRFKYDIIPNANQMLKVAIFKKGNEYANKLACNLHIDTYVVDDGMSD